MILTKVNKAGEVTHQTHNSFLTIQTYLNKETSKLENKGIYLIETEINQNLQGKYVYATPKEGFYCVYYISKGMATLNNGI